MSATQMAASSVDGELRTLIKVGAIDRQKAHDPGRTVLRRRRPQGAAIPKAYLAIHWDSAGLEGVKDNLGTPDNKTATTDATGHFSFRPAGKNL
jgi:hypothetical protein